MATLNNVILYHRPLCPFCIRVRRHMSKHDIKVQQVKNISQDRKALKDLVNGGGKQQVPALSIRDEAGKITWLYESSDIIRVLDAMTIKASA